ncbi:MAG: hypothetical protein HY716_04270 [Planctomycetes bacterium]|nr:hypothetical protein [Planctomycetota bacterium]
MLPRLILAAALGWPFLAPTLGEMERTPAAGTAPSQEDQLEELRSLRRARRQKEAEIARLKDDSENEEAQKKTPALQDELDALGASLRRLVPEVVEALLTELKAGTPKAAARTTARLAEVGAPAVPALEALATSDLPNEKKRAQAAIALIQEVEADDSGLWKQWAAKGKASSAYSGGDKDGWKAKQACGKPDTEEAGDFPTAWASQNPDGGEEWIELTFRGEVRPARIRIRETFNPGAVVKIAARDSAKEWRTLWEGKDETKECPGYLDVTFDPPDFATRVIRITLACASVKGWNEVDAVQLIGEPTGAPLLNIKLPVAEPEVPILPPQKDVPKSEAIHVGVQELLRLQEKSGRWIYELPSDGGEPKNIWLGIEVGGTAVVAEALLFAAPEDKEVQAAVHRALAFILEKLAKPKMAPLTRRRYDYRIWGHCLTLQLFCYVRARNVAGEHADAVKEWIPRLIDTLVKEESRGGGWTYAGAGAAAFVTAPVLQSLLVARSHGEDVPDEILERGRKSLETSRMPSGAYYYGGNSAKPGWNGGGLPGSAGRTVVSEATLLLLGGGSPERLQFALDNFHKHWNDLALRRQKRGTHGGKYGIASYYFYFAHRYAAQAVELLPEEKRAQERERMFQTILKTRDEDGTWNDRPYKRSRVVGTAYALMVLLAEDAPPPPRLAK